MRSIFNHVQFFLKLLVDTSSLYVRDMSDDVCTEYYVRALLSFIV